MLLTESYREQNKELHKLPAYGTSGHNYAAHVENLCSVLGTKDVLDYGCGKQTLQASLSFQIRQYDPCLPGFDSTPEPADIVACTDVLEHIEPDCLDAVLDDLRRVTRRVGFYTIDTRPAVKVLPDGRNAHLIQQPAAWWFPRLFQRFAFVQVTDLRFESRTTPGLIKSKGLIAIVREAR